MSQAQGELGNRSVGNILILILSEVSSSCTVFLDRGRVLRRLIADNLNVFLITQVDDVQGQTDRTLDRTLDRTQVRPEPDLKLLGQ